LCVIVSEALFLFAGPVFGNITDEQQIQTNDLQQDSYLDSTSGATVPGGETSHASRETTPGTTNNSESCSGSGGCKASVLRQVYI